MIARRVPTSTTTGAYLGPWGSQGSGEGQLPYPCGIPVAPDGTVVVTNHSEPHDETGSVSKLMRFDASGTFLGELSFPPRSGGSVQSLGVGTDSMGRVYVIQGDSVAVYAF